MNTSSSAPVAFSYVRFSTSEQMKGDSLRRQTAGAQEYCARHSLTLDNSLSLRDLGVSGFKGGRKRPVDCVYRVGRQHRDNGFANSIVRDLNSFLSAAPPNADQPVTAHGVDEREHRALERTLQDLRLDRAARNGDKLQ